MKNINVHVQIYEKLNCVLHIIQLVDINCVIFKIIFILF